LLDIDESSAPPTVTVPPVGLSRPPRRFNRVVLPEPEGPISARKSRRGISRSSSCNTSKRSFPFRYTRLPPFNSASTSIFAPLFVGSSWFLLPVRPAAAGETSARLYRPRTGPQVPAPGCARGQHPSEPDGVR